MPRLWKLLAIVGVGLLAALPIAWADKPADKSLHVDAKTHANYTETIEDKESGEKATFEMIAIPGGTFWMGSPATEKGRNPDEGPQHPVAIKPFWMGKCEVSWDEFELFFKRKWKSAALRRTRRSRKPTPTR